MKTSLLVVSEELPLLRCSPVSQTMYGANRDCWNVPICSMFIKKTNKLKWGVVYLAFFCLCVIQTCVMWMWSRTYIARCLLEIRSVPLIVKIPVMNLSEKNISKSQWKPFIHQGCVVLSLPQLLVFWATGKATQSGTAPDTSVLWFYVKQLQSDCWQQVFPSSQWFMKPCSSLLRALRQNISTRKCCSERCHNAVLKGVRPQQDFRLLQHTTMSHRSGSVEYLGSGKLMGSMKVG